MKLRSLIFRAASRSRSYNRCSFGTGLTKPLEGNYAQAVEVINTSGKDIWSIDVPSGLSSESGQLIGPAVHAKGTVALAALKFCHILPPASELCGIIYAVDIGIPTASTISVTRARMLFSFFRFGTLTVIKVHTVT